MDSSNNTPNNPGQLPGSMSNTYGGDTNQGDESMYYEGNDTTGNSAYSRQDDDHDMNDEDDEPNDYGGGTTGNSTNMHGNASETPYRDGDDDDHDLDEDDDDATPHHNQRYAQGGSRGHFQKRHDDDDEDEDDETGEIGGETGGYSGGQTPGDTMGETTDNTHDFANTPAYNMLLNDPNMMMTDDISTPSAAMMGMHGHTPGPGGSLHPQASTMLYQHQKLPQLPLGAATGQYGGQYQQYQQQPPLVGDKAQLEKKLLLQQQQQLKKAQALKTTTSTTPTTAAGSGPGRKKPRATQKDPITFDPAEAPNDPFPDQYECLCYINGKFLSVHIIGSRTPDGITDTDREITYQNQALVHNIIPTPFPPETIVMDYSTHPYVYYVHFDRWDRRMDQWVTRDRLRSYKELVRFLVPYSLRPGAVGKFCNQLTCRGFCLSWQVIELLRDRYPGMIYYSPSEQSSLTSNDVVPPHWAVTAHAGVASPNQVNPSQQLAFAHNSNIHPGPVVPPPLLPGQSDSWLVPLIIPTPLPVVPVLPPNIYTQNKLMQTYEGQYQRAAFKTLQLVMSTPLSTPPPDQVDTAYLAGLADANNNANNKRATRTSKKNDTQLVATTSSNGDAINSLQTYSDGWRGPCYSVECPEDALLHYGPDDEEEQHIANSKFKTSAIVVLGRFQLSAWYYSPYPLHYLQSGTLWCCEFCFSPFNYEDELQRHQARCSLRHPPGQEIYRSKENNIEICMFEVDGALETTYCENLSYFAKIFLDHKYLYWDCSIFYYYVMCEVTPRGCIMLGYFSKEKMFGSKDPQSGAVNPNNLACILTLPQYQGKAYGKFLISFSYELSRIDKHIGGPERPLSDLGRVSYIAYWTECAIKAIFFTEKCRREAKKNINQVPIAEISRQYSAQCYVDLVELCQPMLSMTERDFDKFSISIDEISQITCVFRDDLIDALKENQILLYSTNPKMLGYCFNLNAIQDVIRKQALRKERKEKELQQKSAVERAKHQAVRYTIPALLRWSKHVQPQPQKKGSTNRGGGEDDDDDEQPRNARPAASARHTRSRGQAR